jgi:hypothetical protein
MVRRSLEHGQRGSEKAGKSKAEIGAANPGEHPGVALFMALRGMGAETFRYLGGGEAWLTADERSSAGRTRKISSSCIYSTDDMQLIAELELNVL